MSTDEILDGLKDAVINFDETRALELSEKGLEMGLEPTVAITEGLAKGLLIVGEGYQNGELFLMELVGAAEVAKKTIDMVLQPEIVKRSVSIESKGKVILGTAAGDIHDIGKNLVGALLFSAGFEVIDIGKDISTEQFIEVIKEEKPQIVGISALLTTTLPKQKELIEALKKSGLRDKVKVMVGGAPATKEWADEIGADGFGADALDAVRVAEKLVG
jgi:corrinoid protein of di/trimethylamine methyltransferase